MENSEFQEIISPSSTFSKSLSEAASDPGCQFNGTFAFFDICGSTAMKQSQTEPSWTAQYGWFYDTVDRLVGETGVPFAKKYAGDGILLATIDDNATKVVSLAIKLQEAIADGNKMNGFAMGQINFNVSIGIATGLARIFRAPDGTIDVVGMIVDKTRRLCDLASPRAIFIDPDTRNAAHMGKISSRVGEILGRRGDDYLGERIRKTVKGISESVDYFEVLWEQSFFGVKNEAAGEIVTKADKQGQESAGPVPPRPTQERRRLTGKVLAYNQERHFGFVKASTGEEFFLAKNLMVYSEDEDKLVQGATIAFVAVEAAQSGRRRQAGATLVVGETAAGELVNHLADHKPGWIEVKDSEGHQQLVFMQVTPATKGFRKGDWLGFVVGINDKGAIAEEVALEVEDDAA